MESPSPGPKQTDRILVAGAPKSGTTGLFFKIRHSLPRVAAMEMFEPSGYGGHTGTEPTSVLAKTLIGGPYEVDYGSFEEFEKKVGLVRDPRDWVISSLLYGIFDSDFCEDDAVTSQILAALRRKEEDPDSTGVLDFIHLIRRLWSPKKGMRMPARGKPFHILPLSGGIEEHYRWRMELLSDFFRRNRGYYVVKYEDFVAGRLEGLEEYLGIPLEGHAKVDPHYDRVERTKGAGDWRNWFLKEDVEFFRPIFAGFMEEFGYGEDWTVSANRTVSADHASGYVRNLIAERRALTLMHDPEKARELLDTARKALRKVRAGHLPNAVGNVEELEGEVVKLQVAVNFLAHQLAAVEQLNRDLETARGKAETTKARLEETRTKLQEVKLERQRLQQSFSWRVTRPLRSLAKRFADDRSYRPRPV